MLAKKIINSIGLVVAFKVLYGLWLYIDAETCAEMPHVSKAKRDKADNYNPF